jgi:hypothetical protein
VAVETAVQTPHPYRKVIGSERRVCEVPTTLSKPVLFEEFRDPGTGSEAEADTFWHVSFSSGKRMIDARICERWRPYLANKLASIGQKHYREDFSFGIDAFGVVPVAGE